MSVAGLFGANRLPSPWSLVAGGAVCALSSPISYYADHRRFVRDPDGKIVADRWQIVLAFAGFQWTRDKANRHFFFSGANNGGGSVKSSVRHRPTRKQSAFQMEPRS